MRVLHVTPHLGGGVGKAHAALRGAMPPEVKQTYVLLEPPRDARYADLIAACGGHIVVADGLDAVASRAGEADIVQFEFWNHPRMFECLARCAFPAMRSVFWSHISGLAAPLIPPGLIAEAGRLIFTTEASHRIAALALLPDAARRRIGVINSGFGFDHGGVDVRSPLNAPAIAYLGTVDFVKMHPGFFDVIDRLPGDAGEVSIWGELNADGPVAARARAMQHPERIRFRGKTADPARALADANIFLYPLQPDHYGTAENALVEAMSLGLVPVVMKNPAEMQIVRHGETGFLAGSVDECVSLLQRLFALPQLRAELSRNAKRFVLTQRTSGRSAQDFTILWLGLLAEPKRHHDWRHAIGASPAEWFLATHGESGSSAGAGAYAQTGRKGSLAHFEKVFAGDASLAQLRG